MCMNAGVGLGYIITEVIGDFPEEEARQFTKYTLARAGKSDHLTDDDWHEVYEVRHGSRRRVAIAIVSSMSLATNFHEGSKHRWSTSHL